MTTQLQDFYQEAKIAISFEHENVLECLGVCNCKSANAYLVQKRYCKLMKIYQLTSSYNFESKIGAF